MLRSGGLPVADAVRRHADECAFCAQWLRGRERLQSALRAPVAPLSELTATTLLDGVRERLIEQCEDAPLGRAVADTLAEQPAVDGLPEGVDVELSVGLADRLGQVPGLGAAPEWRDIRDAVFARGSSVDVDADTETSDADIVRVAGDDERWFGRRARAGAMALTGGLAVAALLYVVLVSDNLPRERDPGRVGPAPVEPDIVFADLTSLAGVEFSPMRAVRHGGGE